MKKFIGIIASPGIAIGQAFLLNNQVMLDFSKPYNIADNEIDGELKRFFQAIQKTEEDLTFNQTQVKNTFSENYVKLLDAHKLILKDPLLNKRVIQKIKEQKLKAESALYITLQELNKSFDSIQNDFFRERRFDFIDVTKRVLDNLTPNQNNPFCDIKEPSVLIAHNLYPSDTINLKDNKIIAFATDLGGKTSHSAIVAQSLEIPAIVGLKDIATQVKNGELIIIDGEDGIVISSPDEKTLSFYKQKQENLLINTQSLTDLNLLPNHTKDGHKVSLQLNLDPKRNENISSIIADGVGLLRTEFIFMDRQTLPTEQEQVALYRYSASKFSNKSFTIRLADLGGDKISSLTKISLLEEDNPFMGLRGVRLLLKYKDLLYTQLRAIIKTASQSDSKIKIMVPMVSCLEEVLQVKKIFETELKNLEKQGIKPQNKIDFGIMVEVPATAYTIDTFLPYIDFVSIGTNDLIQYLLAVDRSNAEVASLYDDCHPSVIRTLNFVIQSCKKRNIPVSICGELASSLNALPFLVGLGVDTLSLSPAMFLRIKNALLNLTLKQAVNLAQAGILMSSSTQIKQLKEDYNK